MVRIILRSITTTLVLRSALLSLSKDARVSKDGHKRDRACGHPSSFENLRTAARRARPPQDEVRGFEFESRIDCSATTLPRGGFSDHWNDLYGRQRSINSAHRA